MKSLEQYLKEAAPQKEDKPYFYWAMDTGKAAEVARGGELIQAGFTVVDPPENPFVQPRAASQPIQNAEPEPIRQPDARRITETRPAQQPGGFTDHTGARSYKRMYRLAHDFHQRHSPPSVSRGYWLTHTPGTDEQPPEEVAYWADAAQDMGQTCAAGGGDPFLGALLLAIYAELEREYEAMRAEAAQEGQKPASALKDE